LAEQLVERFVDSDRLAVGRPRCGEGPPWHASTRYDAREGES
jgi:hypothetical protein